MIGGKVGPYELIEEIGRGGMAAVYRAYQPNTDRMVAVKVIFRAIAADSVALERFSREARLVAKLEHPHILPVYDYNAHNDPPYIVMRYLPTGTLKDVMERGQLPFGEVAYLMGQVASALDYAHRQGVIHRDIKPSNIMVDADGNAFLTDFGIARMIENNNQGLTGTGMAIGTPGYMAPEQGFGMPIDARVDIYALGVMLYEMLTGQLPFSGETPMMVILKHMNEPVPSLELSNPDLPPALNGVVQKAMAKKPEDRYQTAAELAHALSAVVGPTDQLTPVHLQSAASQTMQEKVDASQQTAPPTAAKPATSRATPPSTPSGVSPRRTTNSSLVDSQPIIAATATPTITGQGRRSPVQSALLGAGTVVVLAIIAGAVLLFVTSKNNSGTASGTATAQSAATNAQFALLATATVPQLPTSTAATASSTVAATALPPSDTAVVIGVAASDTATGTITTTDTTAPSTTVISSSATPVPPTATALTIAQVITASNTAIPPSATTAPSATTIPPTATTVPSNTPIPPSATTAPSATPIPPTATTPASATPIPPTATTVPSNTPIPPSATTPPSATPIPPTATTVPPTATIPPTATSAPVAATTLPLVAHTEDNAWALNKIKQVEARAPQPGLSEWYETFLSQNATQSWWEGGLRAPGQYKVNDSDPAHKNTLEMTYADNASYRLFSSAKQFYLFGMGTDGDTFFDSSDMYVRVNAHIVSGGSAYIAARTTVVKGTTTLNGFFLSLDRDSSGATTLTAWRMNAGQQTVYFHGPMPTDLAPADWYTLLILTYQDQVAFFVNGEYLASDHGVALLGGTMALGVQPATTADFSDLQIRDLSPETR